MTILTLLSSIFLLSSKNPVKMSITILLMAASMFSVMWCTCGSSWFPSVLALLFTGGILVMFMMLSSFHPNEPSSKMGTFLTLVSSTTLFVTLLIQNPTPPIAPNPSAIKAWFQSHSSSTLMTVLIVIYFGMIVKAMKKEESSMKMLLC